MPGFVEDTELLTALANQLKASSPNELPAYYAADLIGRSNTAAYQEIVGRLRARGYTQTQVDGWDRGEEFQLAIGLYFCLVNSGAYGGFDPMAMQALDRRKELDKVIVFVNGEFIRPSGDEPGLIVTSGPSTTGSVFNFPDPDDSRIGEITDW